MINNMGYRWRCIICGYIHKAGEAPQECPVCGASSEDFEKYTETVNAPSKVVVKRWVCKVCGYIHEGTEPPDECPLCGAGKESFEPQIEEEQVIINPGNIKKLLILGGGVAAVAAAEAARRADPSIEIKIISRENSLPYLRLNLTRYLAGEIGSGDLLIHNENWYQAEGINVQLATEAVSINLDPGKVELTNGKLVDFDRLILATGAHSFIPPVAGVEWKNVFSLRTLSDAQGMNQLIKPGMTCVCIGGGILGMETAGALSKRGLQVTLLEGFDYLMPRQLNRSAAEVMQRFVNKLGIAVRTKSLTKEIVGDEKATGVILEDGAHFPADIIIITVGVRSNSHLARKIGVTVNNGVVVDNFLRTTKPNVFAAGDVAEHQGILYGSWAGAQHQGRIAGMNVINSIIEFGGLPRSHTLKVLGLGMTSIGRFEPQDGCDIVIDEVNENTYVRFVVRDERIVGAILLGDTKMATVISNAVVSRRNLASILDKHPDAKAIIDYLSR